MGVMKLRRTRFLEVLAIISRCGKLNQRVLLKNPCEAVDSKLKAAEALMLGEASTIWKKNEYLQVIKLA